MSASSTPIVPPKLAAIAASRNGGAINPSYRVNINFQPDLLHGDITVIESISRTNQYHSQFKTGISNGGLLATSGRAEWEHNLFGDFYPSDTPSSTAEIERPKYGALNINNDPYGAAPRFGSCHFRLKPDALLRSTFCFPDSYYGVKAAGTAENFDLDELALGTRMEDPLDWYIEAHIHGPLLIPQDIEALVLDPSYRDSIVHTAAEKLGCSIEWHPGYAVLASTLDSYKEYRGPEYVKIAHLIADTTGLLTPEIIGRAYRNSNYTQQEVKKIWHCLACYGRSS